MDLGEKKGRFHYVANCMVNDAGEFQPPFRFYADSRDEALEMIQNELVPRGLRPSADGRSYLSEFSLEARERHPHDLEESTVCFTHIGPDMTVEGWKAAEEFLSQTFDGCISGKNVRE